MAGTFRSRDNRAWLLHKIWRIPQKEKLKIELFMLEDWKHGDAISEMGK